MGECIHFLSDLMLQQLLQRDSFIRNTTKECQKYKFSFHDFIDIAVYAYEGCIKTILVIV